MYDIVFHNFSLSLNEILFYVCPGLLIETGMPPKILVSPTREISCYIVKCLQICTTNWILNDSAEQNGTRSCAMKKLSAGLQRWRQDV